MRLYPLFRSPVSVKWVQKMGCQEPAPLAARFDVWSIFWNFYLHSKIGHTSFFGTLKKHSRLLRLRFVSGDIRVPFLLEFCLRYWSVAVCCCKRKYNPGVRRSGHFCRYSGNDGFLPPSNWQRRIPWAHCHREHPVRKKIAGPYDPAANSEIQVICTGRPGHYGRLDFGEAFWNRRHLGMYDL